MKKLIVISDWADDSLFCQELSTAISGFINDPGYPHISYIKSTKSSVNLAYLLKTIVDDEERVGRPLETVILQFVGEFSLDSLSIIRLQSGLYIIGPNKEFVYSMIKDSIEEMFSYPGIQQGPDTHPMDVYARVTAHLLESNQDDMELDEAHTSTIPEFDGQYVGHISTLGQIQTTIPTDSIKESYHYGQEVMISINGVTKIATYTDNQTINPETLTLYPGKISDKFLEISDTAAFNSVEPGMKVEINGV